jgi:hypothetical protein
MKLKPCGDKTYDTSPEEHRQNDVYLMLVLVPQRLYDHGGSQRNWKQHKKPPIFFSTEGYLGVKLIDVLGGKFTGIDGREDFPFSVKCSGITIRIHVSPQGHWFDDTS